MAPPCDWMRLRASSSPNGTARLKAARVVSLRRSDGKALEPSDDTLLEGGDTLVLSGKPEALAIAEDKLLRGRSA